MPKRYNCLDDKTSERGGGGGGAGGGGGGSCSRCTNDFTPDELCSF